VNAARRFPPEGIGSVTPRSPSPSSLPSGGAGRLLWCQVHAEVVSSLRVPEFLIGVVAIPVMLFLMFGLPNAGQQLPGGTPLVTLMMTSFGAFGVLLLAIFTFGVDIAHERGKGWLRLIRAAPAPGWAYFAGKLVMTVVVGSITLLALFAVGAAFAGVRMPLERWAATFVVLLGGGLSLSTLGFALGYLARPRAASTIGNLVYLPLAFASGFFFPPSAMPELLQRLAPYLPTYHYGRLVWGTVATPQAVEAYTGAAGNGAWQHVAFLAATFLTFGVLALYGYRRERRRETT
jgi:ABC-2 type transport system permease protein